MNGSPLLDGCGDALPGEPVARRTPATRGGGDALREEILRATEDMMAETGDVSTVTLRAVARRVGVAATSIYLHFKDLDELLVAVKRHLFTELGDRLEKTADASGSDPATRLRAIAHDYVRYGLANRGVYRVLFTPVRTLPVEPELNYIGSEAMSRLIRNTSAFLGSSPDGPEAQLLAVHIWTALHGVVHLRGWMRAFPWPELDTEVDTLMDRLLAPG